jgi:hypothetical protein
MAAVYKHFIFPVTGNTLVKMCQDAYEEGHKSLTVVLRPRIRIIVGEIDSTCRKPQAAVEQNVSYGRTAKYPIKNVKHGNKAAGRVDKRKVQEDKSVYRKNIVPEYGGSIDNGGRDGGDTISIADGQNEVTDISNSDESRIRVSLATLLEGSSDGSSDIESDFSYESNDTINKASYMFKAIPDDYGMEIDLSAYMDVLI